MIAAIAAQLPRRVIAAIAAPPPWSRLASAPAAGMWEHACERRWPELAGARQRVDAAIGTQLLATMRRIGHHPAMPLLASLLAGLLLAASDPPLTWWPLQLVAFVPLWWAVLARRASQRSVWPLGLWFASANVTVTLAFVGLALPIVVVAVVLLLQWTLALPLAARLLARGGALGALGAAAVVTLLEIGAWHAVPMFGTAQCFALPLGDAPWLVAFAAYTGLGGVVFAALAVQALAVLALRGPRRGPLLALATIALAVAVLDAVRWTRPLGPSLPVAASGWAGERPEGRAFVEGAATAAAAVGSALLVTPETGLVTGPDREHALASLGAHAALHHLVVALGVWHTPTRDNRIWFFDAQGALLGEYTKTHLIPGLEDYRAGDGALAIVPLGEHHLGGMICQDDNFTDLARGYGRAAVPLLAVPTNDWAAIRAYHLENSRFRAIECGYAIVRAASNGISALISPRGEIVTCSDHCAGGPSMLTTSLPLGDGVPTVYAQVGDPGMVVGLALLVAACWQRPRDAIRPPGGAPQQ